MHELIILTAKYLFAVIIIISLIVGLRGSSHQRKEYLATTVLAGILAVVLMKISGHFINDPRPFVVGHFTPLIPHAADNGFPSDHTAISSLFALAVWRYSKRWSAILLVLAVLVGAARVAAGVHHPADIVGAVLITFVATMASAWVIRRWLKPAA